MYGKDVIAVLSMGGSPIFGPAMLTVHDTFNIDSTGDKWALAYKFQKSMTDVDEFMVNLGTRTGSPQLLVSVQGVDSAGRPDGTIIGGGSPVSTSWIAAGTAPYLDWITFDNSWSPTIGDEIFVVIEDDSTGQDPDGSNLVGIDNHGSQFGSGFPFLLHDVGAGWVVQAQKGPFFGFRASGVTDDVIGHPVFVALGIDILVSTIGHRAVQAFKLSPALGNRVQVCGMQMGILMQGDYKVGIWDDSGEVISSGTIDKDWNVSIAMTPLVSFTKTWINTDTLYYMGFELIGAGGSGIYNHDVDTEDNLSAYVGHPNNSMFTYNGSTYTKQTGRIAGHCALLISDWDAGVSIAQRPRFIPI